MVSETVPNRIDGAGTAESDWNSWRYLRELPEVGLQSWRSAVIVAAHPDDEVLGVGGTMAMLAAKGVRLRLIAATDGEGSHPRCDPAVVGRTRIRESAAAFGALGIVGLDVIRLGLPDTRLAGREDELAAILRVHCADFDICLAPWESDAHADHEAAGRAARRACRVVLPYPVWMWHWARPADPAVPWQRAAQVPLPPAVAARKRTAIREFTSQLTDRTPAGGPVLPPDVIAHFTRQREVLLR